MTTRRNFFKYLGLASGVAAGGAVAAATVLPDPNKTETLEKLQKGGQHGCLEIRQTYSNDKDLLFYTNIQEKHRITTTGLYSPHITNQSIGKSVSAAMMPGPDGEMYLKTNGKWRRIVTE